MGQFVLATLIHLFVKYFNIEVGFETAEADRNPLKQLSDAHSFALSPLGSDHW